MLSELKGCQINEIFGKPEKLEKTLVRMKSKTAHTSNVAGGDVGPQPQGCVCTPKGGMRSSPLLVRTHVPARPSAVALLL